MRPPSTRPQSTCASISLAMSILRLCGRPEQSRFPALWLSGRHREYQSTGRSQVGLNLLTRRLAELHRNVDGRPLASSDDQQWHLAFITANMSPTRHGCAGHTRSMGWRGDRFRRHYRVLHGLLTDKASGMTLADITVNVANFGAYDPKVDGVFNTEVLQRRDIADQQQRPEPDAAEPCGDRQYRLV